MNVHSAFHVIHRKRHICIIDEDNGISVVSDIKYVMSTLAATKLLRPNMKVLLRDAFGLWDVIEVNGEGWSFRDLEARNEAEALKAA